MTQIGEGIFVPGVASGGSEVQEQKGENWVELQYVDANGKPIGGARYFVLDSEGNSLASGTLDSNGFVRVNGLPPDVRVVQYYFEDDPGEYVVDDQYKPIPNPLVEDDPGYWEKTKTFLSDAWDWSWGVFQGDFNEDPSISQIIARTVLTMIPIVDQIGDAQDIIAALKKLIFDERYDDLGVWFDLIVSIIGAIPEIGSVFKAIVKAIKLEAKTMDMLKLLRRLNWAGSGNAFRFIKKLRGNLGKYAADIKKILDTQLKAAVARLAWLRKSVSATIAKYIDELVKRVEKVRAIAPQKVDEVFTEIGKRLDELIEGFKKVIRSGETKQKHVEPQHKEPLRQADATELADARKSDTLKPGPHAGESIPARGPGRDFTREEREKINKIGAKTGCHTCGSKIPGTKSGNFVPDHQAPNELNPNGAPQQLFPHCLKCSRRQGGQINRLKQKLKKG